MLSAGRAVAAGPLEDASCTAQEDLGEFAYRDPPRLLWPEAIHLMHGCLRAWREVPSLLAGFHHAGAQGFHRVGLHHRAGLHQAGDSVQQFVPGSTVPALTDLIVPDSIGQAGSRMPEPIIVPGFSAIDLSDFEGLQPFP